LFVLVLCVVVSVSGFVLLSVSLDCKLIGKDAPIECCRPLVRALVGSH
jgi:hypothetical protein